MEVYLDKVTLGMPFEMSKEYFETYHKSDLFNSVQESKSVMNLDQVCDSTVFIKSRFYKEFFNVFGFRYQVKAYFNYEGLTIGQLDYFKLETEGPFTHEEIELIENIHEIISTGFIKATFYKRFTLRNNTLMGKEKLFPIAHIVLDSK